MNQFELARRALGDLQEIWEFVSEDSFTAADRLLEEFYRTFGQLAEAPGMGHKARGPHPPQRSVLGAPFLSHHLQELATTSDLRVIHAK